MLPRTPRGHLKLQETSPRALREPFGEASVSRLRKKRSLGSPEDCPTLKIWGLAWEVVPSSKNSHSPNKAQKVSPKASILPSFFTLSHHNGAKVAKKRPRKRRRKTTTPEIAKSAEKGLQKSTKKTTLSTFWPSGWPREVSWCPLGALRVSRAPKTLFFEQFPLNFDLLLDWCSACEPFLFGTFKRHVLGRPKWKLSLTKKSLRVYCLGCPFLKQNDYFCQAVPSIMLR